MNFASWMKHTQQQTEEALSTLLPENDLAANPKLAQAMRYAVLGGGKRIRAMLVFAAGQTHGAKNEHLQYLACIVELIHAYSLVHDDMPCMDNDSMRRGKPTVHVAFGEDYALLVGDALQALAFQILSEHVLSTPNEQITMIATLAKAIGANGMVGGQALDLSATNQAQTLDQLQRIHQLKTGALIHAAVILGAYCSHRSEPKVLECLSQFAHTCGLLFQIVDDILDSESDSQTLGKTAGKDFKSHKATYVTIMGIDQAKQQVTLLLDQAIKSIRPLGVSANPLIELAQYIAQRLF